MGLTYPTPATFWSTGGIPPFKSDEWTTDNENEPYLDWLEFVLKQKTIPQTITTSFADDEQTVPVKYAKRICAGFAQLGVRGVSLIFGSGDGGVGDGEEDPDSSSCFTNDGRNASRFMPDFPASCPLVTAVGGTIQIPETAACFSGGGFSDVFPRLAYQDLAVSRYLRTLLPGTYKGLFNPNGRAIPDVAAQSENFMTVQSGETVWNAGTSAATPAFPALISLLNSARLSEGLPPLGFLNPLIYALHAVTPGVFNDLTVGNNPGCGTAGFNATAGWDPVTGVGTPNFGRLKDIVTGDLADILAVAAKLRA